MSGYAVTLALCASVCGWFHPPSLDSSIQLCTDGGTDEERIARIDNADIQWTGTFVGVAPIVSGRTKELSRSIGKEDIPSLIALLDDNRKNIAAHVLLVQASKAKGMRGPSEWYGLKMTIRGDGSIKYNEGSFESVLRQWSDWFKENSLKP